MASEQAVDDPNTPLEERLAALFAALGVERAHIAARSSTDWEGFAARYSERTPQRYRRSVRGCW
jgi:hypothetical protein